jgi:hypothetical protein
MAFSLYNDDETGTQIGETITQTVEVADGLFSVTLNATSEYGARAFTGDARWLAVSVRCPGDSTFADLGRHALRATPYALSLLPGATISGTLTEASALTIQNNATTGESYGISGKSFSDEGRGVYGYAGAANGYTYGVYGASYSSSGRGVRGFAFSPSGSTRGVYGTSISPDGRGIYGTATSPTGVTYGVYGRTDSTSDTASGIYGLADGASGIIYGVYGRSQSTDGVGVAGLAAAMGVLGTSDQMGVVGVVLTETGSTYGVYGSVAGAAGRGIYGVAPTTGTVGFASAESGPASGIYGKSQSWEGYGVHGENTHTTGGTGVYGTAALYGVHGKSTGALGADAGVYGQGYEGVRGSGEAYGINGHSDSGTGVHGSSGSGTGVSGQGDTGVSATGDEFGVEALASGTAVYGEADATGIHGRSWLTDGVGVYGVAEGESGETKGVYGVSKAPDGVGVLGYNEDNGAAVAAYSGLGGNMFEGYAGSPTGGFTNLRFRVSQAGNVYADGAYHCAGGPGAEPGTCVIQDSPADFAEVLPTIGQPIAGDVLVIMPDGRLGASSERYQRTVVGVYSTDPAYVGGGRNLGMAGYAPLAIVGLVPVHASAENGAITPGDLLVASATPGHAMRADGSPPSGTIIGKALEGLDSGRGTISMLVMLQ